jgi:serine/threonine protein kinase
LINHDGHIKLTDFGLSSYGDEAFGSGGRGSSIGSGLRDSSSSPTPPPSPVPGGSRNCRRSADAAPTSVPPHLATSAPSGPDFLLSPSAQMPTPHPIVSTRRRRAMTVFNSSEMMQQQQPAASAAAPPADDREGTSSRRHLALAVSEPSDGYNERSSLVDSVGSHSHAAILGTPNYLAPEVIIGAKHGPSVDFWALGCIMYECLTGLPPFHAEELDQVFENIVQYELTWPDSDVASPVALDLLRKLLSYDPKQRLGYNGADEVKWHPFFDGIDWDTLLTEKATFVPKVDEVTDTSYFGDTSLVGQLSFDNTHQPSESAAAASTLTDEGSDSVDERPRAGSSSANELASSPSPPVVFHAPSPRRPATPADAAAMPPPMLRSPRHPIGRTRERNRSSSESPSRQRRGTSPPAVPARRRKPGAGHVRTASSSVDIRGEGAVPFKDFTFINVANLTELNRQAGGFSPRNPHVGTAPPSPRSNETSPVTMRNRARARSFSDAQASSPSASGAANLLSANDAASGDDLTAPALSPSSESFLANKS